MCSRDTMRAINDRGGRALDLAGEMLATMPAEHPERERLEERLREARRKHVVVGRLLAADTDPMTRRQ